MKISTFLKLFGFTAAVAGFASVANAQSSGTFGFGIELVGYGANATNNGVTTLYALDQGGGSRLTPLNSAATLNNSWTNSSNDNTPTFNLGTFTTNNFLILTGGSLLTYENGGDGQNVPEQYLNYRVTPGTTPSGGFAAPIDLTTQYLNVPGGNAGDDRWSNESQSINLLSGLAPGTYVLDTYGNSVTTETGTIYDSNGGTNYAATFSVVPESSSTLPLLVGCAGLFILVRRRSLKAC